MQTKLREY